MEGREGREEEEITWDHHTPVVNENKTDKAKTTAFTYLL